MSDVSWEDHQDLVQKLSRANAKAAEWRLRALSLETHLKGAEAELAKLREGAQPVAWLVSCPDDEIYGRGPDKLQFHPLAQHDIDNGYRAKPLYASPQPLPEGEPSEVAKWAIDNSTDSPILTYEKCSVIQDEQAHYVMSLIRREVEEPNEAEVEALPEQPRLVEIDLTKCNKRGINAEGGLGIKPGVLYLAQYGGELHTVIFNEVWFGLSSPSMGFHAQYDPPGENCSRWERLWKLEPPALLATKSKGGQADG